MIIRIMGEGQFRVPAALYDELNEIDNRIVSLVAAEKAEEFKKELLNLITVIRKNGEPLNTEELFESDIIVPPEDMSFEEARAVFTGEGIFED